MVVVVAVIFIASFMWLYIVSIPYSPPEKLTANIATPDVQSREVGEELRWDVTLTIGRVTPDGSSVAWESVRVIVKSSNGDILNEATPLEEDVGVYDEGLNGTIAVEFWYIENDVVGQRLSSRDAIRITGLTTEYEGAYVQLVEQGERFGQIELPTYFP